MSWNSKQGSAPDTPPPYSAQIEEGAVLEGMASFSGTVLLNCRVNGEVVSSGDLLIGEKAVIDGTIRGRIVRISGTVTGDVHATERVELQATARVTGDVDAPAVVVTEGAYFEGECRMATPLSTAIIEPPAPGHEPGAAPLKRSEMGR